MNQYRSKKSSKPAPKVSKPAKKAAEPKKQPHKYKTILCKNFALPEGCKFGDSCIFAHGDDQLVKLEDSIGEDEPQPVPATSPMGNTLAQEATISYNWLKTHVYDTKTGEEKAASLEGCPREEIRAPQSEP